MAKQPSERIIRSRLILENPYAHLDGEDGFSAAECPDLGDHEERRRKISDSRRILQNQYAHVDGEGGFSAEWTKTGREPRTTATLSPEVSAEFSRFAKKNSTNPRRSMASLESLARDIQRQMWKYRHRIWPDSKRHDPIDVLDPAMALRLMGFEYELTETLGSFHCDGEDFEVAGVIDDSVGEVRISRRFGREVRSFTTAHELGHALLHEARGLHRDRPLNGGSISRDRVELEADKFASFFLMPAKLVRTRFKGAFGTDLFELNEATKFALLRNRAQQLDRDSLTVRDLSRILASVGTFNGTHFVPLAEQFGVSIEAMAIRIEELRLIA